MHEEFDSENHPTVTRSFLRGFGSGLLNGALMMGILFSLAAAVVAIAPASGLGGIAAGMLGKTGFFSLHTLLAASIPTLATGLFGGIMAAKSAVAASPTLSRRVEEQSYVPVPVIGMSSPALAPIPSSPIEQPSEAVQAEPATRWAEKTGRDSDASTRIQQILFNRSMTDKDRASALLAEREASAADTTVAARA